MQYWRSRHGFFGSVMAVRFNCALIICCLVLDLLDKFECCVLSFAFHNILLCSSLPCLFRVPNALSLVLLPRHLAQLSTHEVSNWAPGSRLHVLPPLPHQERAVSRSSIELCMKPACMQKLRFNSTVVLKVSQEWRSLIKKEW